MKTTQMIKKGFKIGAENGNLVVLLSVITFIVSSIMFLFDFMYRGPSVITGKIYTLIVVMAFVFIQGGVLGIVRDFVKFEKKAAIRKFFVFYAKKYFLRLLGLNLLMVAVPVLLSVVLDQVSIIRMEGIKFLFFIIVLNGTMVGVFGFLFSAGVIMSVEEIDIIKASRISMFFTKAYVGKGLTLFGMWYLGNFVGVYFFYVVSAVARGNVGITLLYLFMISIVIGYLVVCTVGAWIYCYLAFKTEEIKKD